jgi:Arc/MetJ-type ribon-helix-helix transcriptional regulator
MKTYQVTIPDEFAEFADRAVADGKFDSIDHLFLYAVAQVEGELWRDESVDQEWLRAEVQKGIDAADRGELIDGETVMARRRAKLEAARKQPT